MFSEIYDSWEAVQKEKFEMIFQVLGKDFPSCMKNKCILDLGAGSGFLEEFLESRGIGTKNIVCLEPDKIMIKHYKNFVMGSGEKTPFKKNVFDIAFLFDVMHLVDCPDFSSLKRGCLIIATIFYNDGNYSEKRARLLKKLSIFDILEEFSIDSKEKEFVVIARKN
jgi:SAM-dependent methyltransferase